MTTYEAITLALTSVLVLIEVLTLMIQIFKEINKK